MTSDMGVLESISQVVRKNPALGRAALRAIPDMRWTEMGVARGIGAMIINLRRNRAFWLRDR